ncbi:hypothetical protein K458DRAFT_390965 [Lentithecium fluviatile CBS 122367]|uniref:Uncharacterized protein n=1 Tax=Lentithecium fluviatile CBS 122367 TaxID=1168545 RepID=A0A6G1IWI6_9PLEO|nr:hypothetical protein K458DRAFT_390965 [Lentithecium fluviatile CBS 122367]
MSFLSTSAPQHIISTPTSPILFPTRSKFYQRSVIHPNQPLAAAVNMATRTTHYPIRPKPTPKRREHGDGQPSSGEEISIPLGPLPNAQRNRDA